MAAECDARPRDTLHVFSKLISARLRGIFARCGKWGIILRLSMADLANAHLIYALLREEQIAADFAAALERNFLDEKFFYWLPPSVAAWCDLCNAPAYRNANRALTLLRREAPRLAQIAKDASVICGLGCGEGSKDEILLQAFAAEKKNVSYVAADFSQALIERG